MGQNWNFLENFKFRFLPICRTAKSNSTWCYYLWALGFPGILKGLWDLASTWRFWYSNRAICTIWIMRGRFPKWHHLLWCSHLNWFLGIFAFVVGRFCLQSMNWRIGSLMYWREDWWNELDGEKWTFNREKYQQGEVKNPEERKRKRKWCEIPMRYWLGEVIPRNGKSSRRTKGSIFYCL